MGGQLGPCPNFIKLGISLAARRTSQICLMLSLLCEITLRRVCRALQQPQDKGRSLTELDLLPYYSTTEREAFGDVIVAFDDL